MNDDTGDTAVFDIPLNSAAQGGGFIANEWVHIALESDMDPNNATRSKGMLANVSTFYLLYPTSERAAATPLFMTNGIV